MEVGYCIATTDSASCTELVLVVNLYPNPSFQSSEVVLLSFSSRNSDAIISYIAMHGCLIFSLITAMNLSLALVT